MGLRIPVPVPQFKVLFWHLLLTEVCVCVFVSISAWAAATQHIIWWWDSSSSERLLHIRGERATQRGMEALWGTEEKLWAGEKELYRGCYSPGQRGTEVPRCDVVILLTTFCGRWSLPFFWSFGFVLWQKKAFEEDRASWLKNQFLNMTPFADRRRCSSSDGQSALSISKSL